LTTKGEKGSSRSKNEGKKEGGGEQLRIRKYRTVGKNPEAGKKWPRRKRGIPPPPGHKKGGKKKGGGLSRGKNIWIQCMSNFRVGEGKGM